MKIMLIPVMTWVLALFAVSQVWAGDIIVKDAYARSSNAVTAAAFMSLVNPTDHNDRLIEVRSTVAYRVEIHTHIEDANGVVRMMAVEDGIAIPAGGNAVLERGGDHIMFIGLEHEHRHDDMISVTLTFREAGDIEVMIPVDLDRTFDDHHHNHAGG